MNMLRTTAQRKNLCKTCPYAKAANLLGDSVVLLIIRELLSSKKCFSEIEENLRGVSTRTLSEKLKFLEKEKVIVKQEVHAKPNRVYYSLSKKGKELRGISKALIAFGEKWMK